MKNVKQVDSKILDQAHAILKSGKLVAFPTETIYGLGANALLLTAVKNIFFIKKRPMDNPLISHIGKKSQIKKYAYIDNDIQKLLIQKLMPGPFTLLLRPKKMIPLVITAGQPLMSIRIPDHPIAKKLLSLCDFPVAAPSANLSTRPSPTTAKMVYDNFKKKIPMILDGGKCDVGIESTVVRVKDEKTVEILRPGYITKEDIQKIVGPKVEVVYTMKGKKMSPGTRYRHYAPRAQVSIIKLLTASRIKKYTNKKTALIATQEFIEKNKTLLSKYKKEILTCNRGTESNLSTCAQSLFDRYHKIDKKKINQILIQALPEVGLGYAIMNRVKKSAK